MRITINIGQYETEIIRGNEKVELPTNDVTLALIRFIRDDDCMLDVVDQRHDYKEEDLSFVM